MLGAGMWLKIVKILDLWFLEVWYKNAVMGYVAAN